MMIRKFQIMILLITVTVLPSFGGGQSENEKSAASENPLSKGIEQYNQGNLAEALSFFNEAASADNPEISAAAYYNEGTVQAELAGQAKETDEKRSLLEKSFQSLKRAAELGRLPAQQKKQTYRNMEIVREQLSQLPEKPPEGQEGQEQQEGQDDQQEKQQQGQPQDGQGSQNSQGEASQDGTGPEQMLQQQRDLSSRTGKGDGSDQELAAEQKQLQKASEDAGMNDAAVNQAMAAKALSQGERDKAMDYQKEAEKALAEAAQKDKDFEAEDILNQEAENETLRNRLDKMGGITDAERNW